MHKVKRMCLPVRALSRISGSHDNGDEGCRLISLSIVCDGSTILRLAWKKE